MRATVWGCRGSLAAPGPETVRYGGNTCLPDARAGRRHRPASSTQAPASAALGAELANAASRPIHLLLTHLHLDHIEGLGFFAPLWSADQELHFWGPPSPVAALAERIARYLSPPLFPIQLYEVPAQLVFHDLPAEQFRVGSAEVLALPVSHRGPTVGFRVTERRRLARVPPRPRAVPRFRAGRSRARLAVRLRARRTRSGTLDPRRPVLRGASTPTGAGSVTRRSRTRSRSRGRAGAGRLVLFHHDPTHSDAELERKGARARELWGGEGHPPELARDRMQLEVKPRTPAF